MNATTLSFIGTVAAGIAGMIAGWLAAHNIIPVADVTQDTALIGTGIAGAAVAGFAWIKSRSHTPAALTAAVNSDAIPGVKVMPLSTPGPAVNATNDGKTVLAP